MTEPITDEELAEIDHVVKRHGADLSWVIERVPRLIAALLASRAEVGLVAEEMLTERSAANTLRMRNGELRAEVERLRAEIERAHLLRIEAQNPGIDMDEVRNQRANFRVDL